MTEEFTRNFTNNRGLGADTADRSCTNTSCCPPKGETHRRTDSKIGRNELCPCEIGRKFNRKYKKCCGKSI